MPLMRYFQQNEMGNLRQMWKAKAQRGDRLKPIRVEVIHYRGDDIVMVEMSREDFENPLVRHMTGRRVVQEARLADLITPFVVRMEVEDMEPIEYRVGVDDPGQNIDDVMKAKKAIEELP